VHWTGGDGFVCRLPCMLVLMYTFTDNRDTTNLLCVSVGKIFRFSGRRMRPLSRGSTSKYLCRAQRLRAFSKRSTVDVCTTHCVLCHHFQCTPNLTPTLLFRKNGELAPLRVCVRGNYGSGALSPDFSVPPALRRPGLPPLCPSTMPATAPADTGEDLGGERVYGVPSQS